MDLEKKEPNVTISGALSTFFTNFMILTWFDFKLIKYFKTHV